MKNNFYLGIYYDPIKPAQEWIINERVRNIDKQFILDDLQHIKDLGLKYVRLPLRWILIEQRKDKLDFSFYDCSNALIFLTQEPKEPVKGMVCLINSRMGIGWLLFSSCDSS